MDLNFTDALFENMSAWTGTGFTIFNNVAILPYSILFLRSLEQWIGGLGIIVVFAGLLIRSGNTTTKLYLSEGREDKIRPSIRNTIHKIFQIYTIYTLIGIIAFVIVGLPVFDAVNLCFTAIATGGMSIKNANIGYYHNNLVYFISMIIMIIGATSFSVHARAIKTKGKSFIEDIQFKYMIGIIIVTTLILFLICKSMPIDIVYHVISASTTTGSNVASTSEVLSWNNATIAILFVLMLMGGSAGSTAGGIKLERVIIALKGITHYTKMNLSPEKRKIPLKIAGKLIKDKEILYSSIFIVLYFIVIVVVWFLFILYGFDPLNSLFDVISAQSNTGLSTGVITRNLPDFLKYVLIIQMWMGRLEIIPVLVLIHAIYDSFRSKSRSKRVKKV